MNLPERHQTLKQLIDSSLPSGDYVESNFDKHMQSFLELAKKWLEDKKLKRLATEAYLKPKAETDIIHRHMYFMNGSELDLLNELLKGLE